MASRNTQLDIVPTASTIVNSDSLNVMPVWTQWFLRLRYFMSNENHQSISNVASVLSLDAEHVAITATTANYAITLESPTIPGRYKTIQMVDRSAPYAVTLSLTNVIGGSASTTATFDSTNETLVLRSLSNGKWLVIKEHGVTLT